MAYLKILKTSCLWTIRGTLMYFYRIFVQGPSNKYILLEFKNIFFEEPLKKYPWTFEGYFSRSFWDLILKNIFFQGRSGIYLWIFKENTAFFKDFQRDSRELLRVSLRSFQNIFVNF